MPNTGFFQLMIGNRAAEYSSIEETGIKIDTVLEEPENWENIQSTSVSFSLPLTKNNCQLLNDPHSLSTADLTPGEEFGEFLPFTLQANGVTVLQGKARIVDASFTDKPEQATINCVAGNGDWIVGGQNLTLWDCLSDTPHTFDLETVQASWGARTFGGYDADETKDYVYAPVRYRQPFGANDDRVNIYHLRPSISIYWLLVRGFRQLGYTIKSRFLESQYFHRMVLPWVWGDFYDINGSITDGLKFKAAGTSDIPTTTATHTFWTGLPSDPLNTQWAPTWVSMPLSGYVKNDTEYDGVTLYRNYKLNNTTVPEGYDNLGLYSFDNSTGTMMYSYNPPASLATYISDNATANFSLNLIAKTGRGAAAEVKLWVETTHIFASGAPTTVVDTYIDVLSLNTSETTKGSLLLPTPFEFSVSNLNKGDTLRFRIKYDVGSDLNTIQINCSEWLNTALSGDPVYIKAFSSLQLTGLQVTLGGTVNFKWYDAFRNYRLFDLLGGLVDAFDLEMGTNPVDMTVTIEPSYSVRVPSYDVYGNFSGMQTLEGYFKTTAPIDWSAKQDLTKVNTVEHYAHTERFIDFQFKTDSADGGQSIYSARYKGVYIASNSKIKVVNAKLTTGLRAAMPGASRYVFPNKYAMGDKQKANRFFSATMHYNHSSWAKLLPNSPAPQLITIFPENITDSSASSVTQTFEPRIAFYAGQGRDPLAVGAWRFIGDPATPYDPVASILFPLPFMFSVNYGSGGATDPVLSYSDQLINSHVVPGLMRNFFLSRLAIMRNGKILHQNFRLNLNDYCNYEQRNAINIMSKGLFVINEIENFSLTTDESNVVRMWQVVDKQGIDLQNSYPSENSIANNPPELAAFDLKYAPLLLFSTDIPQA